MAESWQESRQDHRARQAEAIAATAFSLLAEHGASGLTMAGTAAAAGVSRQTLYRYYDDIDAVLVGVAELIASHDEQLADQVDQQADPTSKLDLIVRTVIEASGHHEHGAADLRASLPPQARRVLSQHEDRIRQLLADALAAGVDSGVFRHDLSPASDAPLILGLATAADPTDPGRAMTLVHRMVDGTPQETTT